MSCPVHKIPDSPANRAAAIKPAAKSAVKPKPVVKPKPPIKVAPKPKNIWDKAKSAVGSAAGAVGRNAKKVVTSDITQGVLDACGLVPVAGEACDLANAGTYAWEGDKVNAALSLAAAIPVAGTAATAGKYAVKYGDNAVNLGRRGINVMPSSRAARLPQDVRVAPHPPDPLPVRGRSVGRSSHDDALLRDLEGLPAGARDIRVNQQQVNAKGQRVGINRPDLQYRIGGQRYYIEYEGRPPIRGPQHYSRIKANDPTGHVTIKEIP